MEEFALKEQVAYILDNKILSNLSYTQINGKLASSKRNFCD